MITLKGTEGDITRSVPVDAIVTLINPQGAWFGGVDGAIQRIAGGQYHAQAAAAGKLRDGQVIIAKRQSPHRGTFKDVIFVVDALTSPLHQLVLAALNAAHQAGYEKVGLPLMRTGVMLGIVEKTVEETILQIRDGIDLFKEDNPDSSMELTVVVYNEPRALRRVIELSSN